MALRASARNDADGLNYPMQGNGYRIDYNDERGRSFLLPPSLTSAYDTPVSPRTTRLVGKQNRHGQMIQYGRKLLQLL